jgi:hypothetical protein
VPKVAEIYAQITFAQAGSGKVAEEELENESVETERLKIKAINNILNIST